MDELTAVTALDIKKKTVLWMMGKDGSLDDLPDQELERLFDENLGFLSEPAMDFLLEAFPPEREVEEWVQPFYEQLSQEIDERNRSRVEQQDAAFQRYESDRPSSPEGF